MQLKNAFVTRAAFNKELQSWTEYMRQTLVLM